MQQLDQALESTELRSLRSFNTTYLIITQNVSARFGKHYFDSDHRMQIFDILFAKYYFDALYHFVRHRTCAPAWELLFTQCQKNKLMRWQYLALGVNAHVNNDLPLALQASNFGQAYYTDFQKINQIIYQSIPSVVRSFQEQNYIINWLKNNGVFAYQPILKLIIKCWRSNAWEAHHRLQQGQITPDQIAQKAMRVGKIFIM
jgi:hypothetical protein